MNGPPKLREQDLAAGVNICVVFFIFFFNPPPVPHRYSCLCHTPLSWLWSVTYLFIKLNFLPQIYLIRQKAVFSFLNVPICVEIDSCMMLSLSDVQSSNAFQNICKNPKVLSFSPQAFPHTVAARSSQQPTQKREESFYPSTCVRGQKSYYDPKSVMVGNA